ncbi:MAG TPA: DedA family protein [Gemmatimonadales bacterium]|nr:DedA family protein [Gemmatimonadales bacterium]
MEFLKDFVDLFLHLDQHLGEIIRRFGGWSYLILFGVIFCETGLVVTPFLPGDSLLFAAGTFAGIGAFQVWGLVATLTAASILGDSTNYWVGRFIGQRAFSGTISFLKYEHLEKTRQFYRKHGRRTIIIARFLPIVRTFAPFVAGVGQMPYLRFVTYSILGSVLWVGLFVFGGYLFGNLPVVRQNFSLVIVAIIGISVLPIALEWLRGRRTRPA